MSEPPGTTPADPDPYLLERVREALAEDPRLNELHVEVHLEGPVAVLSGPVTTTERRTIAAEVAAGLLPGVEIRNELEVVSVEEPEGEEPVA